MCEFDELVDDAVDHDHCYFFHQQLEKRARKRGYERRDFRRNNVVGKNNHIFKTKVGSVP